MRCQPITLCIGQRSHGTVASHLAYPSPGVCLPLVILGARNSGCVHKVGEILSCGELLAHRGVDAEKDVEQRPYSRFQCVPN